MTLREHGEALQIAADAAGNALAVWQHDDGTRYNIQANRYDAATQTWSGAALIETDDTGAATIPQIVMNPSGYGMAVWQHNDGTRENIQANRFE
jgi:protocatechuate 3,4-dioxygenase beta subunit